MFFLNLKIQNQHVDKYILIKQQDITTSTIEAKYMNIQIIL